MKGYKTAVWHSHAWKVCADHHVHLNKLSVITELKFNTQISRSMFIGTVAHASRPLATAQQELANGGHFEATLIATRRPYTTSHDYQLILCYKTLQIKFIFQLNGVWLCPESGQCCQRSVWRKTAAYRAQRMPFQTSWWSCKCKCAHSCSSLSGLMIQYWFMPDAPPFI